MQRSTRAPERSRGAGGFTLVELVVVLLVLGLALAFAVPNIQRARVKANTSTALRVFEGMLINARSEALKRHSPVVVAFNTTSKTFTVFEDWDPGNATVASNGNGVLDGSEEAVTSFVLDPALTFGGPSGFATVEPGGTTAIEYDPDGTLRSPAATVFVRVKDIKGNYFQVQVNNVTGASRVEKWLGGTRWSPRRESWVWSY